MENIFPNPELSVVPARGIILPFSTWRYGRQSLLSSFADVSASPRLSYSQPPEVQISFFLTASGAAFIEPHLQLSETSVLWKTFYNNEHTGTHNVIKYSVLKDTSQKFSNDQNIIPESDPPKAEYL